jgi:hypothetical protein
MSFNNNDMIIYNVTIKVDWQIHEPWLEWMKERHIPEMLATGYFEKYQLVKLLNIDELDGPTYALQCYARSKDDYQQYSDTAAAGINNIAIRKWGNRLVIFETLMEVIH